MIDRTDQVGEGARAKTPAGRFVVCFTRADYRQAASGLEKYLTEEIEVLAGLTPGEKVVTDPVKAVIALKAAAQTAGK